MPLPITEWLYLEGRHGDEWMYTWTGRHHNRGETIETTTESGFSAKVKFKIGDNEVELGPSSKATIKHKIAYEDCFLGSDIAEISQKGYI